MTCVPVSWALPRYDFRVRSPWHQAQAGLKRADHVNGRFTTAARTPHRFAVDRDRTVQIGDHTAHPAPETGLELLRVKQSKHPQKRVFRRNAVLEHEELAQPYNVLTRPCRNVFNRVAIRKYRRDRHHQHFHKIMPCSIARLARVIHVNQYLLQSIFPRQFFAAQKTRVDGIFLVFTSGCRKLLKVNHFSLECMPIQFIPAECGGPGPRCKLDDVSEVGSSKRVFVEELVETGIPFYRGTEVGQLGEGLTVEPSLFISPEHFERLKAETGVPTKGDLLLPSICPDGRIFLVQDDKPFYFKDGRVLWINLKKSDVNSLYLRQYLKQLFMSPSSTAPSEESYK
jgi:hypothetical protein